MADAHLAVGTHHGQDLVEGLVVGEDGEETPGCQLFVQDYDFAIETAGKVMSDSSISRKYRELSS